MDRELIEKALQSSASHKSASLLTEDIFDKFSDYFGKETGGACNEKIISDESLFRDYSRLGGRKVDFARVRNPFTLSKYTVSSYEKTWHVKNERGEAEGPYNSYDMDGLFKKEKIKLDTLIGINKGEFFRYDYFVEIVYPLPKVKQSHVHSNTNIKGVTLFASAYKFSRICDESEKQSQRSRSTDRDPGSTPFKRTPFKHVPEVISKTENLAGETFVLVDTKRSMGFNSSSKNYPAHAGNPVAESFLVKNAKHSRNKFLTQSSKDTYKLEMNDIIGNYTAIKCDADTRQYVDLNTKLDFHPERVEEKIEKETEEEEIDGDFDFDDMGVSKKN